MARRPLCGASGDLEVVTEAAAASLAAGSDADITVANPSLAFTADNWDIAQEVTVSAAEDADATDGSATIEHAASGGGYGGVTVSSVTATESDNDTAGVTGIDEEAELPSGTRLYQNYPNPFNSRTTIVFSLRRPDYVRLAVYDVIGREIAVLRDGLTVGGVHEVSFNADNVSGGAYVYKLETATTVRTGIMLFAK